MPVEPADTTVGRPEGGALTMTPSSTPNDEPEQHGPSHTNMGKSFVDKAVDVTGGFKNSMEPGK